ncbi:hypothetical protein [Rhizobium nepotum]|uniref:hypothetical protein n=1 Tax=Rhizobium nepotum TaxID=1035271 RepID=UPI003CEAC467
MTDVNAYAINTIMRRNPKTGGKETIDASTKQKVSVFALDEVEFEKLAALGAVRKASKEEIAIAKVQSNDVSDAPTNVETALANEKAPASGAQGDPQGKPKGATKAPSKDEEI